MSCSHFAVFPVNKLHKQLGTQRFTAVRGQNYVDTQNMGIQKLLESTAVCHVARFRWLEEDGSSLVACPISTRPLGGKHRGYKRAASPLVSRGVSLDARFINGPRLKNCHLKKKYCVLWLLCDLSSFDRKKVTTNH